MDLLDNLLDQGCQVEFYTQNATPTKRTLVVIKAGGPEAGSHEARAQGMFCDGTLRAAIIKAVADGWLVSPDPQGAS